MENRPVALSKFLPSSQELGNTSSSEGEKDSPPPEWDAVPVHKPSSCKYGFRSHCGPWLPRLQALRGGDAVSRSDRYGWPAVANFSQSASVWPKTRNGVRDWATYTREGKGGQSELLSQPEESLMPGPCLYSPSVLFCSENTLACSQAL